MFGFLTKEISEVGKGAVKRRERARQEMREDILRAARRMVEQEGLANLSLRGIARELGYSPAALYEYFPSKEAIARALYFEGTEGLSGRMERALAALSPDTSPMEAKKELGRAYRSFALEQRELFLLIFGSGENFSSLYEQMERGNEGYEALLATVQRGIDSGEFAQLPAEVIAFTSWSAVHGFVMLELAGIFEKDQPNIKMPDDLKLTADQRFEMHMDLIDLGVRRR
jgi:AcrR family transcriptional regulator